MRIASLHTYPLKGCRRLDHEEAGVDPWGLAGDRRWMLVDPDGVGITQREVAALSQLRVRHRPGGIAVSAPGLPAFDLDEPVDGPEEFVRVFKSKNPLPVRIADDGDRLASHLGVAARPAWQADPTGRPVGDHGADSDRVSLADGFPVLLANAASLSALNDWLAEAGEEPVPITRFRPNVVVSGFPPWAEDDFRGRRLRIGDVVFRAAKPCDRCVVTTIDQDTGEKTGQPLKMLGRRRRFPDGLLFGMNLIPDVTPGAGRVIRVGDEVTPLF